MRHGHVIPNEDGSRARCGGPGICSVCALELAQKRTLPTAFICGKPRDHKCDDNGPVLAGGDNVPTKLQSEVMEKNLRGYSWGSVSCSVCGNTAIENSYLEDD